MNCWNKVIYIALTNLLIFEEEIRHGFVFSPKPKLRRDKMRNVYRNNSSMTEGRHMKKLLYLSVAVVAFGIPSMSFAGLRPFLFCPPLEVIYEKIF